MEILLSFAFGLAVTAGILVPLLLRARGAAKEAADQADILEEDLGSLQRTKGQLEEEQRFLTRFMHDFPHLAKDLFIGLKERQIPAVLLNVVQKSLDPAQSLVLVRRGGSGQNERRFVVAAMAPETGVIRIGAEVAMDAGEVGFAADARSVVSRADLESETALAQIKPAGPNALSGFAAELLAPLVFGGETLGMIALSKPRSASGDAKAALRVISETGAQALQNASTSSQLRVTAEMDSLTHIFNKRHMEQALSELIYRAACAGHDRDQGAPAFAGLSVFLFDIDHFKHYNDTNGHLAGDKLLQELARMVPGCIRKDDIFGRFGGEEFLLILPNTNLAQALSAANKVRAMISNRAFPFAERQPLNALTISGGVAEYPYHGRDSQGLLHAADDALYEAKRHGRNRVVAAATAKVVSVSRPAIVPARPAPGLPQNAEAKSA
jgi:diguanylate cyclase (GGDEF)-like protein